MHYHHKYSLDVQDQLTPMQHAIEVAQVAQEVNKQNQAIEKQRKENFY